MEIKNTLRFYIVVVIPRQMKQMIAHAEKDKREKKPLTHCEWEEKLAHPLQK